MNTQERVEIRGFFEKITTSMHRIKYWVKELVEIAMSEDDADNLHLLDIATNITVAQGEIYRNQTALINFLAGINFHTEMLDD